MTKEERLQFMKEINEELLRWLQPISLAQWKTDNADRVQFYDRIGFFGRQAILKKRKELALRNEHNRKAKRYYE